MKDTVLNNRNVATINERIVNEIVKGLETIEIEDSKLPFNLKGSFKKSHGNLVAMVLRKYISNIINYYGLNYKVSICNSYVEGSPIEWDLIILKDTANEINKINIYNVKDCVCILEIKASGIVGEVEFRNALENQVNHIKYLRKNGNSNLQFAYISFQETKKSIEKTKQYFNELDEVSDNVFTFVKYPYDAKLEFIEGCEDFEKYLFNILDKNNNSGSNL